MADVFGLRPDFSSINLAHAVMIVCYEIFLAGGVLESRPMPRIPVAAA